VGDKIIPRRYEYIERFIMNKFKVFGFEKIYYEREIEAENEEDARSKALADVQENHWTFWDDQEGDVEICDPVWLKR